MSGGIWVTAGGRVSTPQSRADAVERNRRWRRLHGVAGRDLLSEYEKVARFRADSYRQDRLAWYALFAQNGKPIVYVARKET